MQKPSKKTIRLFKQMGIYGILLLVIYILSVFWYDTLFNSIQSYLFATSFILISLSLIVYKNGLKLYEDD